MADIPLLFNGTEGYVIHIRLDFRKNVHYFSLEGSTLIPVQTLTWIMLYHNVVKSSWLGSYTHYSIVGTHSKTSDWIQELNLQSPVPHYDSKKGISFSSCDSSVKKKGGRKPLRLASVPGGLAEQMQKVLEREKSSLAFWLHKSKNDDEYSEG